MGKEGNGSLQPLLLELKLDKRGLEANEEVSLLIFKREIKLINVCVQQMFRQKQNNLQKGKKGCPKGNNGPVPLASLEQKHPVSLLGELASKRKWGAPSYELVHEQGPAHAKNFIFKVKAFPLERVTV